MPTITTKVCWHYYEMTLLVESISTSSNFKFLQMSWIIVCWIPAILHDKFFLFIVVIFAVAMEAEAWDEFSGTKWTQMNGIWKFVGAAVCRCLRLYLTASARSCAASEQNNNKHIYDYFCNKNLDSLFISSITKCDTISFVMSLGNK